LSTLTRPSAASAPFPRTLNQPGLAKTLLLKDVLDFSESIGNF
jgi:hypothetical protein